VVTFPERVTAEGPRLTYDWDESVTEWYLNDSRGLEHGYTVHQRPAHHGAGGKPGLLTFSLAVRGELYPIVVDGGRGVHFVDCDDALVLTYSGLKVFDADGQALHAGFDLAHEGLVLSLDERSARYPLTIDPIAQQAYLKASNTGYQDHFGQSVAVSGDTVVVGAPSEGSQSTGVNGDQGDNSAGYSGAVYVFVRSGATWSQQAYLKASNTEGGISDGDQFGRSVALSGDTVVVGARGEDSNAVGVNGDQNDNNASYSGAAYVFVRNGTTWSQQAYLKASNTDAWDEFGGSVAVSGDTVVVGAERESSGATGVDGAQGDNGTTYSGAAYVFVRYGTSWLQQAYLKASNAGVNDYFGHSVAISDETVIVGASGEDSGAIGVNGDQGDTSGSAGAAYVFVRNGTDWTQQAYLKASNTDQLDDFGASVAVSGDTVVVGARAEDSNAVGVNGDQGDNSESVAGAAYVFVRMGTSWSQQAYLKASNTAGGSFFGHSVDVSGDTVIAGAYGSAHTNAGEAYVFVRVGSSWSQHAHLTASNPDSWDRFGHSVAVSGDSAVIGAYGEASGATGVNGSQANFPFFGGSGAAYVFKITGWFDKACALAGVSGDPLLVGSGELSSADLSYLHLSHAAPSATAGLFIALSSTPVTFKGGSLKPFPFLPPVILTTSASGVISIPFLMPSGVPAGTELWAQWAIQDAAAVKGVALSNAIQGVTP
jgi:hypothetical protein